MYRVTTPTHTFKLPFDPTGCEKIIVTYYQRKKILEKTKTDMTIDSVAKTVSYSLTQAETKQFSPAHAVKIQMRVLKGGVAMASAIETIPVNEVLNDEVI